MSRGPSWSWTEHPGPGTRDPLRRRGSGRTAAGPGTPWSSPRAGAHGCSSTRPGSPPASSAGGEGGGGGGGGGNPGLNPTQTLSNPTPTEPDPSPGTHPPARLPAAPGRPWPPARGPAGGGRGGPRGGREEEEEEEEEEHTHVKHCVIDTTMNAK